MSRDSNVGARFALWWVEALTRTAERTAALDRRAEIASDVHEQLTDAWRRGVRTGSPAVIARVVRGMPSDISWRVALELRPGRFAWHLRNPSTAMTTLLVAMFPLNAAADSYVTDPESRPVVGHGAPLWAATYVVSGCILAVALLALAARLRPGWISSAEQFRPRSRLEGIRRRVTAALGVTLAASAVLRFTALDPVSGLLWVAFVLGVLVYLALLMVSLILELLTLGRYLLKVRP